MKKLIMSLVLMFALSFALVGTSVGPGAPAELDGPEGPAPNSGDCDPDGSGFDPEQEIGAPNSGDGIPDGPGW